MSRLRSGHPGNNLEIEKLLRAKKNTSKERAHQYMLNFECPSCHKTGTVRVLKLGENEFESSHAHILGSCKHCRTVVELDREVMMDHEWRIPHDLKLD